MASGDAIAPTNSNRDLLKLIEATADHHDLLSSTPHLHMAFIFSTIINNLKEKLMLAERSHKLHASIIQGAKLQHPEMLLLSGSSIEGLYIPVYLKKNVDGTHIQVAPDFDAMLVNQYLAVGNDQDSGNCLVLDPSGCHCGYTRLKVVQHLPENSPTVMCIDSQLYLTKDAHSQVNEDIIKALTIWEDGNVDKIKDLGVETSHQSLKQGPALTGEGSFFMWEKTMNIEVEVDTVPAINAEWPVMAKGWILRQRSSSWPSTALIQEIVSGGCHVVPVSHSYSIQPRIEWRLSFSKAEISLAHSLTSFQRSCYRLFKILCHVGITPKKVIATYFLKTTFFWLCQEMPVTFWEPSNVSFIIITLIEKLLGFLAKRNVPNFFIAENNMIDHIVPEKLEKALRSVLMIRCDPLKYLMQFAIQCTFAHGGLPWNTAFRYVMEDIPKYMKYKFLLLTLRTFEISLNRCGVFQVTGRCYPEALENFFALADIVEITTKSQILKRLVFASNYSLNLATRIPQAILFTNLNNLIEFYYYLLSLNVDYKEKAALESIMGYIYLVLSQLPAPKYDQYYTSVLESLSKVCVEDYNTRFLAHTVQHLEKASQFLYRSVRQQDPSHHVTRDCSTARSALEIQNKNKGMQVSSDTNENAAMQNNGNTRDFVLDLTHEVKDDLPCKRKKDLVNRAWKKSNEGYLGATDNDSPSYPLLTKQTDSKSTLDPEKKSTSIFAGELASENQKRVRCIHEKKEPLCGKDLPAYCRLAQVLILQGRADIATEHLQKVISHPRKSVEEICIRWFEGHLYELDSLLNSIHKNYIKLLVTRKDTLNGHISFAQCAPSSEDALESLKCSLPEMGKDAIIQSLPTCNSEKDMPQNSDSTTEVQLSGSHEDAFTDAQNTEDSSATAHQTGSYFSRLLQSEPCIKMPCDLFAQYLLLLAHLHQEAANSSHCIAALESLSHWYESHTYQLGSVGEGKEMTQEVASSLYKDCTLIIQRLSA